MQQRGLRGHGGHLTRQRQIPVVHRISALVFVCSMITVPSPRRCAGVPGPGGGMCPWLHSGMREREMR